MRANPVPNELRIAGCIFCRMNGWNPIAGILLAGSIGAAGAAVWAQGPSLAAADAMQSKLARIETAAKAPRAPGSKPLRTSFSEQEINAYFEHYGADVLPPGIAKPRAVLQDHGRIVVRARVDLDAVARAHERSVFDPLAYLQGSLEVVAAGTIAGDAGRGVIRFESATVAEVAVPKTVAQELLRFYTRTPERPRGFEFDEPFPLPARMQSVTADRGSITVSQ
jgi:hypothetical protein